jgi:acyl carrier protein
MTMKTASRYQTPCETLRQINDLHQSDSEDDKRARDLLAKFEGMVKTLAKELNKRPGERIGERWWGKNELDWRRLRTLRMSDLYKTYSIWQTIKDYIIKIIEEDNTHLSSCMFPEETCGCKGDFIKDIDYGTSLLRGGYVDSFTVESIASFLEEEFSVEIPTVEINPNNFDTINKMVKLIKRL